MGKVEVGKGNPSCEPSARMPAADSSEMASGVPREANDALKSNYWTAQGTVGESCALMRCLARTCPT